LLQTSYEPHNDFLLPPLESRYNFKRVSPIIIHKWNNTTSFLVQMLMHCTKKLALGNYFTNSRFININQVPCPTYKKKTNSNLKSND
jgi:hypothetical protein